MHFLAWLLASTALNVVGYLLMRPDPPEAPEYDDFEMPTADVNRPVPYVFGTVDLKGPNIVWVGDKRIRKQSGKSGGIFSKPRAPAVQFNCGVIFGFCYGPVDALLTVRMKDKILFPPSHVESEKREVQIVPVPDS